jgi:hypothetical protein
LTDVRVERELERSRQERQDREASDRTTGAVLLGPGYERMPGK